MTQTYYLAKTDPETYSIDQLEAERRTVWDGVRNAQALRAIAAMHTGDRVFIYHSMGNAAIMGLAKVVSEPREEPPGSKLVVVAFEFVTRLDPPVTLREIKETHEFDDWALVRQSRLSTMEAPEKFVKWMRKRYPEAGI
ncbi:MAG: hypothetical protein JWO80_2079 [Bryobacterales bacterium]|nr:hypothetical protein [Bryobacterales bacterium]